MIFDWPGSDDFRPMSGRMHLVTVAHISASPYTGSGKAVTLAQVWKADFSFNSRALARGHDLQGLVESLEGPVNPVRMFDWWRQYPAALLGGVTGFSDGTLFDDGTGFTDGWAPMVASAAAQGARFVHMEGLPEETECFRRGDLFGIDHHGEGGLQNFLHEVRAGVTSNANGEALVPILPGLRKAIAPSDAIRLWRPKVHMRLLPDHEALNRSFNAADPITLSFVEDVQ
jgi:hypothetical protein